jgi:hypothetical protein
MNIERFVNDQNLERFRKLASDATSEAERRILLELLAEEQVKLIELRINKTFLP